MQSLASEAFGRGLEIACNIGTEVPREVIGGPGRLRQILGNLVGNAIKFTERGEILLTAACLAQDETGVVCQFSVKDSGIGKEGPEYAVRELTQEKTIVINFGL